MLNKNKQNQVEWGDDLFADRIDAGRQLSELLVNKEFKKPLVVAIPRGGVIVGAEIARRIKAPLDIVVPRKLGLPYNSEVAIGAIAQDGTIILDTNIMSKLGINKDNLCDQIKAEINEIKRRMQTYRGSEVYPDYSDYDLIIVDDGIATGHTMLAALRFSKKTIRPRSLVLAVPVCPPDIAIEFEKEVEQMVCLLQPDNFYAVGQYYKNFEQTDDAEVKSLINALKLHKGKQNTA